MLHKIAIIGPESSGKSELAAKLAAYYETNYCIEYAREYLHEIKRPYQQEDLIPIAIGQIQLEERAISIAKHWAFFDTNVLSIIVWSLIKYGSVDEELWELQQARVYDHYLLLSPDLDYVMDPLRESPNLQTRQKIFLTHQELLEKEKASYSIIGGKDELRLKNAINALQSKFN